jgi:hypothetical protein
MSAGTSFPAVWFLPAVTPLTRRLLVYFASGAYNTVFEELTCVGYNPDKKLLEAVIRVKQPTGYSGDECTPGSYEYIRFFVDTGKGFQDAGLMAINVHDIPDAHDCANGRRSR